MSRTCMQRPGHFRMITIVIILMGLPANSLAGVESQAPRSNAQAKTSGRQAEIRKLEVGKALERELQGGDSHTYAITLKAGEYLSAVVEQRGIDVVVSVLAADGKPLLEMDSPNGDKGDEPVDVISQKAGLYRLQIKSLEKAAPAGKYEIRVTEVRAASEKDRSRIARERLIREAAKLADEANGFRAQARYDQALPLAERVLSIREKNLGEEHPLTAQALNNLAELYFLKGDYVKAELFKRVLTVTEKAVGPEHPSTATALSNLAQLYSGKDGDEKSEPLYLRALAITEKALGKEHPLTALSLHNLASVYDRKGDYGKAESLYLRALAIYEKAVGAEHPNTALTLNNLAGMYSVNGDFARAEPLMLRALAIREKMLGPAHPTTAFSLYSLSRFYLAKGDYPQAIAFQIRANETDERELIRNLASGSERQKIAYLNRNSFHTDSTLSMHLQFAPADKEISRAALTRLLRRKGRALDAMTDAIAQLRRHASAADQKLLDQLAETRSQHSNLVNKGVGREGLAQYKASLEALEAREEQLETGISGRSVELRAQLTPVTVAAVQQAIPAAAALVEFAAYRPYEVKARKYGAHRYAAYTLTHQGEIGFADLGEAAVIDRLIAGWRQTLRQRRSDVERQVKPLARQLDEKLMRPVRALLGGRQRLLISPDGVLNLIPFDALVDEKGDYLVEHYSISYLTSGRDLLRLPLLKSGSQTALILADPDFDNGTSGRKAGEGSRILERQDESSNSRDKKGKGKPSGPGPKLGSVQLERLDELPGSAKEGRELKKLLKDSTILTGAEATEAAVKRAASPGILHISTHGGFLEDAPTSESQEARGLLTRPADANEPLPASLDNPLLRAGLFFAGANTGRSADEDGVLTALEAAGLDLYGTRLVILSACDTGVGEVKNGDGVYGLRRAFVLAGAETQLISLWPVSDEGTRELMVAYYKRLKSGEGRGEALRRVRLKMLDSQGRSHPFYWASFIQSGEWANLDGKRLD